MNFNELADFLNRLESISSRNEMVLILSEMFKKLNKEEIAQAMYLIQGRVAPMFLPIEFNFSVKMIQRALPELLKKDAQQLQKEYETLGDLGLLVERFFNNKSKNLKIIEVYSDLLNIAQTTGTNSQQLKLQMLRELAAKLSALEFKYVVRILSGTMRLGLSDKTILDGLSWALVGDKSQREEIERAYGVQSDLGIIAEKVMFLGIANLDKIRAVPGIPIASKLVEREKDTETIFKRLGECYVQPKYDGVRMQIHINKKGFPEIIHKTKQQDSFLNDEHKDKVRIFSRNMEEMTHMFPDVVAAAEQFNFDSAILDAETVGFSDKLNKFIPFQETIKRKRKSDIQETADKIPVKVFVFDILHLNGEDLMRVELIKRMEVLNKLFKTNHLKMFELTNTPLLKSHQEIETFFRKMIDLGLEGIIAKSKSSFYEAGTRNYDWIKLKRASQEGLADTVDAVVLGYYFGTGVRAKFGIGAILIGTYDPKLDKFLSLAKVGTGIKDDDWLTIKSKLDTLKIADIPANIEISDILKPDVIVKPEVVVVVEADEVTKSKVHGGEGGFSLRFPRLKVFDRKDKNPQDITTPEELSKLFQINK